MHGDSTRSESALLTIPPPPIVSLTPASSQIDIKSTTTSVQLTIVVSIFHRGINAASAVRRKSILIIKIPLNLFIDYVFAVRVIHVAFKLSSPISEFTIF
jgi:hypothetical protein